MISMETEALLECVISKYGDVPFPASWDKAKRKGETLAKQARVRLDALQSVAVGKVPPDIHGEDTNGRPMKLYPAPG